MIHEVPCSLILIPTISEFQVLPTYNFERKTCEIKFTLLAGNYSYFQFVVIDVIHYNNNIIIIITIYF